MTGLRVLALLMACALFSGSHQPSAYKIAGHVVHGDGRPVRHARVTIAMVGQPGGQLSAVTGDNGEFLFYGLPAAKYNMRVDDHGWSQLYEQSQGYSTAIAVGTGVDSEHILFVLAAPAGIAGTVLDDEGEPVRFATIYLFGGEIVEGKPEGGLKGQTATDSDGRFHFKNLKPGVYYVAAFGRPWYAQEPVQYVANGQVVTTEPKPELNVAFPLTYYGGARTPDGAAPLTLVEGMKAEIQIALQTVPALRITFDGVEKQPEQQIQASLSQIGPGGARIQLPLSGWGGLMSAPPGDYLLSASLSGQSQPLMLGSQSVTLSGNSTVHLNEAVKTTVTGKVVIAAGDLPEGLAILLRNSENSDQHAAPLAKDGQFDFQQAPEGRYALRLANYPDVYIQRVQANGAAYANGELQIPHGAQVSLLIQLAKGVSKVNGVVVKDKKPFPGAMVLLVPQDLTYCNYIPRDQSDSDGTFTLNWAAPGRYTLIAIDNGQELAYADPAVIKTYLQHGKVLDVPVPKDTQVQIEVQARSRATAAK